MLMEKSCNSFPAISFFNPVDPVDPVVLFFSIFHLARKSIGLVSIGRMANGCLTEKLV
jgi:hypothetical protein